MEPRFLSLGIFLLVLASYPAQCRLPRFPESLAMRPEYSAYLDYSDEDRIVGGELADEMEFPYQASLQRTTSTGYTHFCGACVVAPKILLTAAHCVHGRKEGSFTAVVGSVNLYTSPLHTKGGSRYKIAKIWSHHDYDTSTVDYDLALIELADSMTWDDYLQPLKIPKQDATFETGAMVNVSGWGTMQEGGSVQTSLRYVTVPIVDQEKCVKNYNSQDITKNMICAGFDDGGKDSCQGDSGGPLVSGNTLVGIVSWGYGCARPSYPGVYTRIAALSKWVQQRAGDEIKIADN